MVLCHGSERCSRRLSTGPAWVTEACTNMPSMATMASRPVTITTLEPNGKRFCHLNRENTSHLTILNLFKLPLVSILDIFRQTKRVQQWTTRVPVHHQHVLCKDAHITNFKFKMDMETLFWVRLDYPGSKPSNAASSPKKDPSCAWDPGVLKSMYLLVSTNLSTAGKAKTKVKQTICKLSKLCSSFVTSNSSRDQWLIMGIYPIKRNCTMIKVSVLAKPNLTAPALYQTGILRTPVTRSNCNKVLRRSSALHENDLHWS